MTDGEGRGPAAGFVERTSCPVCGAPGAPVLRECRYDAQPIKGFLDRFYSRQGGVEHEWLRGAAYVVRECRECGLVFQQSAPDGELARRLYEHWIDPDKAYEVFERHRRVDYFFPPLREIADVIDFLGGEPADLTFLDFGSGWGHWARLARGFGCAVFAADLAPSRSAAAGHHGIGVLPPEELGVERFDYINAEQVFEHLPKPAETLRSLARSLRPGGLILVSVPDGSDVRRRLRGWDWAAPEGSRGSLIPIAPLEHVNCFSHSTIVKLGEVVGLEEAEVPSRYYVGKPPGPLRAAAESSRRALRRAQALLGLREGTRVFLRRSKAG